MPAFYGFKIQVGETKPLGLEDGIAATIGQVALVNGTTNARYILSVKMKDEEYVLATLTREKTDCLQDLNLFADQDAQFCLRTEDNSVDRASVHVVGYLQEVFEHSSESEGSFDEDEYNERLLAQMNGGVPEDSSESENDQEDEQDEQDEEAPPLIQLPAKTKKQAVIKPLEEKPVSAKRPTEEDSNKPPAKKVKTEEKKKEPVEKKEVQKTGAPKTTAPVKTAKGKGGEKEAHRCTICTKDFKNAEGLSAHNKDKHKKA